MRLPPDAPTLEAAIDALHRNYDIHEVSLIAQIDDLQVSGIADKRWCAVARTAIEQGFMALHRSLRDYPGDDANQYGKVPSPVPLPDTAPPVDTQARRNVAPTPEGQKKLEGQHVTWQDYNPDQKT
jgi:hypothetical protein